MRHNLPYILLPLFFLSLNGCIGAGEGKVGLKGQVFDGRDLEGGALVAAVQAFDADGVTPLGDPVATDASGNFSIDVSPSTFPDGTIVLKVSAEAPFLPMTRAFAIVNGKITLPSNSTADALFCLSSTYLSGTVTGPDGSPAIIDLWVKREPELSPGAVTEPYEVCGGRDFIAPVPASGMMFGVDTDALGHFMIPIRVPDGNFDLVVAMDRNTDQFAATTVEQIFVTAGEENDDVTMSLAASEGGSTGGGGGGGGSSGGGGGGTATVSFASDIQPIFNTSCTKCHSGPSSPFGEDLSAGISFSKTVNVAATEKPEWMRINPGDSSTSWLYWKVSQSNPGVGGRMPADGNFLDAATIQLLKDWIDQGALDN